MSKLTLEQFCNLWAKDARSKQWHSILAFNAEEFATKAGEYALSRFRTSFAEGGLYGTGSKWAPRESKWGKKFTHPIMNDRGELKSKIKGEVGKHGSYSTFGKRDYSRKYSYGIWTEEKSIAEKGKRGRKRGRNQNYAAVHNTDPKFGLYTVNQYSSRRPVHRQFIGHSAKLLDFINRAYTHIIFNRFPHTDDKG